MHRVVLTWCERTLRRGCSLPTMLLALVALPSVARAQNIISVPFTDGFIGTRGSSAGSANAVLTYATLEISRTFFIQSSSTTTFELQGNDIPGTMRIVRTNGTTLDIPASANWRNSGGSTYLIGILPRPVSPVTLNYTGGSIQITDGSSPGGSSVGGYIAGYGGAVLIDGDNTSGNAAQSQVLSGLNSYLSTVVASRPNGPVTVNTLSTTNTTPTLTGTATLAGGDALSVVVNGIEYTDTSSPAVQLSGNTWTLALSSALALGTYPVTATITDGNGFTLSDATTDELQIVAAVTTVTLSGSFTANSKTYDGTTSATGSTGSLTLVGVNAPHQVTIASVTLAFQTATAGGGKTVVITGYTLGGADAASYTPSLAGAPSATATINAKALTISGVSAANKVYNGSTAATLSGTASYVGLASGENFAVTGTPSAAFATASIGTGKGVTVTGYTAPNANYTLTQPTGLTANITTATLSVGGNFTADDRVYDRSTSATGHTASLTLSGVYAPDQVTIASTTLAFQTGVVGTGKTVTITALTLGGTEAANYAITLAGAPTATAAITPKGLTIGGSFTAANRTYDGTTSATISSNSLSLVGVEVGDAVSLTGVTAAFATAAVGNGKTVSLSAANLTGGDAGNYTLSLSGAPTTTANITSAGGTVTIGGTFTANNKQYDGTVAATGTTSGLTLSGVNAPDVVTIASVTIAFQSAGAASGKTVVITGITLGGADAALYAVNLTGAPTATAAITAKGLTIAGVSGASRPYDGTTVATLNGTASYVGLIGGQSFSVAGTPAGAFASAAVGTAKAIVVTGYQPPNANYSVTQPAGLSANVTARVVTLDGSFDAADKLYDGSVSATIVRHSLTMTGVVPGTNVSLTLLTAIFSDSAIGNGKIVSLRTAALTGSDAANYSLSLVGAPTTVANILPASPPSAPRNVTASPAEGALHVQWDAPLTAGCRAVSGYLVEVSADDGRTWTRTVLGAATPTSADISGLVNNLTYDVRVAASNSCGTGPFAVAPERVVPIGPTRDGAGTPVASPPGGATVTSGGTSTPVTVEVVQDTTVRIASGEFTLNLRTTDEAGSGIPVDSSHVLQLEQAGHAEAEGSGFAPGTLVTLYLFGATGEPLLLGRTVVTPGGTFTASVPIDAALPPGNYTLQVNGIDRRSKLRAVALGVEVEPPPAELELAATPDQPAPAVGDTITITLTVTNIGRGAAIDVVIPRAFNEPGFTIVKSTPIDGTYDATTQEWHIARIDVGGVARLKLTVIVLPRTPSPSTQLSMLTGLNP